MLGLEFLKEVFRVSPPREKPVQRPPTTRWRYGNLKVHANTKSEARAILKALLRQSLPVGAGKNIKVG